MAHVYKVVEKLDHNALHAICSTAEMAAKWIERYGNSKMFMDKTLTAESFEIIAPVGGAK